MKILLLSHQLDFTGAPIALLQLARTLKHLGHDVSLGAMSDGPLGLEFAQIGIKQFDPALAKTYDLYVANTVLAVPVALDLAPDRNKVIAWIHESLQFFQMCNWSPETFHLSELRRAIFPSRFQMDEFRSLLPNCELAQLRNLVSMQGVESQEGNSDYFSVTGTWEPRKNQEGLLRLIALTQLPIKVDFLGAVQPDNVSSGQHRFLGQIPLMEAKMVIAGSYGLISAAVSETQNLAAIEAMMSGNPVLLSDIPAHRELKELIPNVVLFDTQDPQSFLAGYEEVLRLKKDVQALSCNQENAIKYFGNEAFTATVKSLLG